MTEAELLRIDAETAEWNQRNPVGTTVRYWPVMGRDDYIETTTRSGAWVLGDGTPVVSIVGKAGGVALSHIEVIQHLR